MKPDDLIEYSKQAYSKPEDVNGWCEAEYIKSGLTGNEKKYLEHLPINSGELLLLGMGGGREAIPLAQHGFHVTGVDFVPEMVDRARVIASAQGVHIDSVVQEISRLDFPDNKFTVVWYSRSMYSSIPTRKRRVEIL